MEPIRIVAAIILDDQRGRTLLVRKRGTKIFMQPGGKREREETDLVALQREILEELSSEFTPSNASFLGTFQAAAPNEPGRIVEAALYQVQLLRPAEPTSEIDEIAWVDHINSNKLELAPLTRQIVLPLIRGQGQTSNPRDSFNLRREDMLLNRLRTIQRRCDELSFSIHGKRFRDLSPDEILFHKCFHLGKALGKLSAACEAVDHGVEYSIEQLSREVVSDLIIYALQIANLFDVDLDSAFERRIGYVLDKHPDQPVSNSGDKFTLLADLHKALIGSD